MKKENKTELYQEIGDYLVDISKLVFGGVILAGIMNIEDLDKTMLFGIGSGVVFVTGTIGLLMKVYNNKKQ